jgi:hypothetical protein
MLKTTNLKKVTHLKIMPEYIFDFGIFQKLNAIYFYTKRNYPDLKMFGNLVGLNLMNLRE